MDEREELKRLIRIPSSQLSDKELIRKGSLLSKINVLDLEEDEIEYRWFLGKVKGNLFFPLKTEFSPIKILDKYFFLENSDLVLGKCEVYQDGYPKGDIFEIEMVG